MSTIAKWSVVVGNGKRMSRKWRKIGNLRRMEIYNAVNFHNFKHLEKGEIVNKGSISKVGKDKSSDYDLSFQPDMEAGCY